jgi:hypothetical protein
LNSRAGSDMCSVNLESLHKTCAFEFCNDCYRAGECDYACDYCTASTPASTPTGSSAPIIQDLVLINGRTVIGGPCSTDNVLDVTAGGGTCQLWLASGARTCADDFAYEKASAGMCDGMCEFNRLDSERGGGSCAMYVEQGGLSCQDYLCDECEFSGFCDYYCETRAQSVRPKSIIHLCPYFAFVCTTNPSKIFYPSKGISKL